MTGHAAFRSAEFDHLVVLANRPLRPDADPTKLSHVRDDRWYLNEAVFEGHSQSCSVNFLACAPAFRMTAKRCVWVLLNTPDLREVSEEEVAELAVVSIERHARHMFAFLNFLEGHGVRQLSDVTEADYEAFAEHLMGDVPSLAMREDRVEAVRRLWRCRRLLPAGDALPDAPPWAGDQTQDIVGSRPAHFENERERIDELTMRPLLLWALRWVDVFATDVLAAWREYMQLVSRQESDRFQDQGFSSVASRARAYVEQLQQAGESLPGWRRPDGSLAPRWRHIERLLGLRGPILAGTPGRTVIERSGLTVGEHSYLDAPITATLDGEAWRSERISYHEVHSLMRLLTTACFIVVTYLSGMRPGEALGIGRGCVTFDDATELWLLRAVAWKGVVDSEGRKRPEGELRRDPWVVVAEVERAVKVLEALAEDDLLFPPARAHAAGGAVKRRNRGSAVMMTARMSEAVNVFIHAVNEYCAARGRTDVIPLRDGEVVQPSQLRRTLAWHIFRRPNGVVAGALQYGHLHTRMFVGYAGNYESGFTSVAAVEDLLARLDRVAAAMEHLDDGGRVSGPAAAMYRTRMSNAAETFAGRTIRTTRQAEKFLQDPDLQVFSGDAMTCVYDPNKALCSPQVSPVSRTLLPVLTECNRNCQNIARTDDDMEAIRQRVQALEAIVDDSLSPPIRLAREKAELTWLRELIEEHDR